MTIEEMRAILDELEDELPEALFNGLNGGVLLNESEKLHPANRADDLFIMGEYHNEHVLGCYIVIYYGSFIRLFGHEPAWSIKNQLRKTLRHELTHHIESRAGDRSLEEKDAADIDLYLRRGEKKRYRRRAQPE